MILSNETKFSESPNEYFVNRETRHYRLIIMQGTGKYSHKLCYQASIRGKLGNTAKNGNFYDEFYEALLEGDRMLSDIQVELDMNYRNFKGS